jgi:predicted nucleotide-binding protein
MAVRAALPPSPEPARLSIDEMHRAIPRLQRRLDAVREFNPDVTNEEEASRLTRQLSVSIDEALTQTFGPHSIEFNRYSMARIFDWPINIYDETPLLQIRQSLREGKNRSIDLLGAAIETLKERIEDTAKQSPAALSINRKNTASSQVFIVHGHDDAARQSVARFVEKVGFQPVILSEQPNQGRTIIEKFEANADVGFAVVLLTPDDEGRPNSGELKPRARQNVILELGYFIGKLGRSRVCALKSDGLEIPSDILGVVWTDYDPKGAWQSGLAKELQAAGYEIDWNKVMR